MMKPRFKYYLEYPGMEPIAYYSSPEDSDVSGETLLKMNIPIPLTPTFNTWKQVIATDRRCVRCWACFRSLAERNHHMEKNHYVEWNYWRQHAVSF